MRSCSGMKSVNIRKSVVFPVPVPPLISSVFPIRICSARKSASGRVRPTAPLAYPSSLGPAARSDVVASRTYTKLPGPLPSVTGAAIFIIKSLSLRPRCDSLWLVVALRPMLSVLRPACESNNPTTLRILVALASFFSLRHSLDRSRSDAARRGAERERSYVHCPLASTR